MHFYLKRLKKIQKNKCYSYYLFYFMQKESKNQNKKKSLSYWFRFHFIWVAHESPFNSELSVGSCKYEVLGLNLIGAFYFILVFSHFSCFILFTFSSLFIIIIISILFLLLVIIKIFVVSYH